MNPKDKMLKLNFRKSVLVTLIVFLTCALLPVYAVEPDDAFTVLDWDSEIEVGDNARYHIKETIETQFFDTEKHGIFRTIPVSGKLERDGIKSPYKAKVENLKVTDTAGKAVPFKASTKGNNYRVVIGDPDKYVNEHMTYVIEYDYDMLGDRLKDKDEVYLNVIGNEWPTDIQHMSFSVAFKKPITPENAGVKVGGSTVYSEEEKTKHEYDSKNSFDVNEYYLTADLYDIYYGEGVSFRCIVPDDYFEEASTADSVNFANLFKTIAAGIIGFFCVAFTILTGKRAKQDSDAVVAPVTVMPPKFNNKVLSAYDMAYIYNRGDVEEKSIMSMLFDLANEGYLSISEEPGKILGKKYVFHKEKEYSGDKYRQMFFDSLFENRDEVSTKTLEKEKFYHDISHIISVIKKDYETLPLLQEKSSKIRKRTGITAGAMIIIGALLFYFAADYSIYLAALGGIMGLCGLISGTCSNKVGAYTPEYKEVAGQIKGFKKFMEYAEKPRLEELVEEYPTYFYDVLPYAYALEVTSAYAKNFEGIAMEPPSYYYGDNFNVVAFTTGLSSSLSSSSSSGGGSFSGGGGGGGGGGGSW